MLRDLQDSWQEEYCEQDGSDQEINNASEIENHMKVTRQLICFRIFSPRTTIPVFVTPPCQILNEIVSDHMIYFFDQEAQLSSLRRRRCHRRSTLVIMSA